ncbi:putative transcription factor interactor and regulator CCHC(Zn) family [Helianthus anomalus]
MTNFVHGTSSEEEKELQFRRHSNEEFYAQKKQQQQAKDFSKRTCVKCNQTGHLGRKCPNPKPVAIEKENRVEVETQKLTKQTWIPKRSKFGSKQSWKLVTPRFRTTQSWKTNVDMTKPNQFLKPKIVESKQNIQNDSRFYKRNLSKGQIWVVKQQKVSNDEKTKENVFEKK